MLILCTKSVLLVVICDIKHILLAVLLAAQSLGQCRATAGYVCTRRSINLVFGTLFSTNNAYGFDLIPPPSCACLCSTWRIRWRWQWAAELRRSSSLARMISPPVPAAISSRCAQSICHCSLLLRPLWRVQGPPVRWQISQQSSRLRKRLTLLHLVSVGQLRKHCSANAALIGQLLAGDAHGAHDD